MSAAGVNPLNMCAIALAWQLNRAAFSAKELHDERKGGEVLGKPKLLAFRKWASAVRLWQAREVRPFLNLPLIPQLSPFAGTHYVRTASVMHTRSWSLLMHRVVTRARRKQQR